MERKLIAAAVTSALALPMAAQAVEFAASGQINRAITSVDGGGSSAPGKKDMYDGDVAHVDHDGSQTRFRFTGSEELENGMTAGVNLEYGLSANLRQANVYLGTAGGKITVGHASTATDGVAYAYLGGPAWLGGTTNYCSFVSAGPACQTNDGGRQGILRYDTPSLGPATISVSTGDNDYWDAMLKIAGSFGDAGYDFRVGYIGEYDTDVMAVAGSVTPITGKQLMEALKDDGFKFNAAGDTITSGPGGQSGTAGDIPGDAIDAHNALNKVTVRRISEGEVSADPFAAKTLYHKSVTEKKAMTKPAGDIATASAAVSFGQGTSVAVAWSKDDVENDEYQFVNLDHSYGAGSVGLYFKQGEMDKPNPDKLMWDGNGAYEVKKGTGSTNHEGEMWGVGVGHDIGSGATVFAGYAQISEDGMNDIDILAAGMRVTFN